MYFRHKASNSETDLPTSLEIFTDAEGGRSLELINLSPDWAIQQDSCVKTKKFLEFTLF